MKARVINESSAYSGVVIDVKLAGSSCIYGYPAESKTKVQVPYKDVELVFEYEWEKNIVKYKELLKIRLPRTASMKFYAALCYSIEQHFPGEIVTVSVVKDVEEKVRKRYWYKNIEIIINDVFPVNIRICGREYIDHYDIDIEDMDAEKFTAKCREGICRLKDLIGESSEKIKLYERVLYGMEHPLTGGHMRKAIEK